MTLRLLLTFVTYSYYYATHNFIIHNNTPPLLAGLRLVLVLHAVVCSGSEEAKRLYDDLLEKSNYNKLIRPMGNDSLIVKIGLRLTQIIDVVSTDTTILYFAYLYIQRKTCLQFNSSYIFIVWSYKHMGNHGKLGGHGETNNNFSSSMLQMNDLVCFILVWLFVYFGVWYL